MNTVGVQFVERKESANMSWDEPKIYLVEFQSGRTIYVSQWSVEQVKEYCSIAHEKDSIKAIYHEVYVQEECEDA